MKKTDLMKAIEKFDGEIAKHQQAIDALQTSKGMLEAVAKEKSQKTKAAKKTATASAKRAPRVAKANGATAAPGDDDALFATQ